MMQGVSCRALRKQVNLEGKAKKQLERRHQILENSAHLRLVCFALFSVSACLPDFKSVLLLQKSEVKKLEKQEQAMRTKSSVAQTSTREVSISILTSINRNVAWSPMFG